MCLWAGRFVSYLVTNPKHRFFRGAAQMSVEKHWIYLGKNSVTKMVLTSMCPQIMFHSWILFSGANLHIVIYKSYYSKHNIGKSDKPWKTPLKKMFSTRGKVGKLADKNLAMRSCYPGNDRYCKNPKNSDTQNICCNHPRIWTRWLCHRVMRPNDEDRMASSMLRPVCLKT